MSKVKVQEATKELNLGAGKLLEETTTVRREAQDVIAALKKIEKDFLKQEEAAREEIKAQEQREIEKTQSKAWTMPDTDDAPAQETPKAAKAEKPKKTVKAAEETAQVPASEKVPEKVPAVAKEAEEKAPEPQAKQPAPVAPTTPSQPAPQSGNGRPFTPRPFTPAPNRPQGQAQGQQSGNGRPFTPRPFTPRPFTPAPNRPQGQAQGPQSGNGRPFTPRPFTPAQNRPQGAGQQGARPFTPNQGGGFNRGGAPGGRPMGGGAARNKGPEITPAVEKERVSNYDPNKKMYQRQHDPERVAKNRKQMARSTGFNGYDDDFVRNRKRPRKPSAQQLMTPIKIEKAYMTAETITVKDLTERIGKPAGDIIKKLLLLGIMATINQELDFDTAQLVCSEFGVDLELKLEKTAEDILTEEDFQDNEADLITRPPVVTIMGHVDHGKTSLLDYIRKTKVAVGEAGGITQHIGAYTAQVDGRAITFLDTPGHEAFTAMRARGTQATDIAILVVAADDGVMPQTIESISHAKAAKVPMIVAVNKIDKEGANLENIKQELTRHEIVPEEWGGDTIIVPVSAKTGQGIDDLLENILLVADVQELRANPNRKARGVIIEAKLDKSRGPVATVLVQNGTLHVGDNVVAGMAFGRVRAMTNPLGERVKEAGPSMPVEVIGFNDVPEAGEELSAVGVDKLSRQVVEERRAKLKAEMVKKSSRTTLDELYSQIADGEVKDLNIIIKADVQGSVEAVKQSLEKLSNEDVRVRTIHSGVGAVTENDVMLANIDNAIIIGFNVRADAKAQAVATREGIDIRFYRVIYQAIEDVEKAMKGMLDPVFKEVILGHAEVRSVFKITGSGVIAGSYVTDGKMQRNAEVRLLRDNVVVYEGKLSSLKRFKDDAKDVSAGFECGIGLEKYDDIKEGDIIECFIMEEIER